MKVVTFGELMLRLEPPGYLRFVQTENLSATFGGAEANVAISLANFGVDSCYVTKLPSHEIGQAAVNSLRKFGVNTQYIVRGGPRVGIYYNERGASQRGSKCIYDRAGSSIQLSKPEDFDWKQIMQGASWFHITGITPALGPNLVQSCIEAAEEAHKAGATVSLDLNYRAKLWSREEANKAMTELCKYVDICVANEDDAADVFGIKAENTDTTKGELSTEGYKSVARQLMEKFAFKKVAITLRTSINANRNDWQALLYDGKDFFFSKKYEIWIVDRVGGGDSFTAGLIYSLLSGKSNQEAVEFAVAASCLKHTIEGDFNMVSVAEVEKLASGNASGRIQR
ncbi:MAG: sugar kinase [Treponema sp.]|jgi:2-dehydro-3-deoxygluconokinase|nr:sugar kinase [Treponema sp.]MBQ1794550.1 sugar kinase [Treponema sp.]MBQ2572055.1 sugar kinase [Treponema sp.]MBQ3980923.1 sugar kinase [Treponema sp.]MBR4247810.1 sugar kinase [Treponema sp.]